MDYAEQFRRDAAAFEAAARVAAGRTAAPAVPSCPGWVVTDLVLHLGVVHRAVARVIRDRMQQPPLYPGDRAWLGLPGDWAAWLPPGHAPRDAPVPAGLLGWFAEGAAALAEQFQVTGPDEQVWTWSADHTAGFWRRMQAIEAAVHRWDAQSAVGEPEPVSAMLAADAIGQTFEVMVPMRRAMAKAPPGQGERFAFQRTDGSGGWAVRFDADTVTAGPDDGPCDVRIFGTASDLALFLWQRPVTGGLRVQGNAALLSRYFTLVPPL